MTHLDLFSGIGGLSLAAEMAGFTTVAFCEWADYPYRVLEKHWPDVPKWRDIRTLTGDDFYARTGLRTVDVVSGGFPCQPFSVAGKQRGKEDERFLWPEMLRVIREIRPTYIIGENVPGILRIAADEVCTDLEREGYAVRILDYEAAAVGAPHRRERIAFVAYTNSSWGLQQKGSIQELRERACNGSKDVADTNIQGLERRECGEFQECACEQSVRACGSLCDTTSEGLQNGAEIEVGRREPFQESKRSNWWATEPNVGRVAHGIPKRVDRLKCLGNAVVPEQFYPIFKAIAELEET